MFEHITRVDVMFIGTSTEHRLFAILKHYSSKLLMLAWGAGNGMGDGECL